MRPDFYFFTAVEVNAATGKSETGKVSSLFKRVAFLFCFVTTAFCFTGYAQTPTPSSQYSALITPTPIATIKPGVTTNRNTASSAVNAGPCSTPPTITCPGNITPTTCGSQVVTYALPTVKNNCATGYPLNLTQSTSTEISDASSQACGPGQNITSENSYYRLYDLGALGVSGPYTVTAVTFAVALANNSSGSQTVNVRLYTLPASAAFTTGNLIQIASQPVVVANQYHTIISAPLSSPPTVAANARLVVEVNSPDASSSQNGFFLGGNAAAQTGESYLRAPSCGISQPRTYTDLGYANTHIILNLEGVTSQLQQIAGLPSGATFPVGTTTNTFRVTDGSNNSATCSFNVTVNPPPTITSQPANTFVCSASRSTVSFSVTATGNGTLNYRWYKGSTALSDGPTGSGSTLSGTGTRILTITNAGSADAASDYNVQVTLGGNCAVTSNNAAITSNPSPNIFDEPDDVTICAGSQAVFGVSLSISGNPTFRWFKGSTQLTDGATGNGSSISGTGTNILRISNAMPADNASNYYMIISSSNGCSDTTRNTTLQVNPAPAKPVITANGPTTFCSAGGRVTLSAPSGFASYTWSNGATTQSITVTQGGSYTVTVGNGNCTSPVSDPVTVTVNPSPNIFDEPDDATICAGSQAVFGVSLSISGNPTFRWFKGATQLTDGATGNGSSISGTGTNILRISNAMPADNASNYYMIISSSNGCADTTRNTTLQVNPAPAKPVITTNGSTNFCANGSVTLSAPAGFSSYTWSNGATTQSITVTQSGSYTVTVSNGNCTSPVSDAVVVNANATPERPVVTAGGPTVFCAGGSVTLSAPAGFTYRWSNGATTQSITVTQTGSYSVSVINSNNCESPASAPVTVTVNPQPAQPTITAGGPTTFCAGGSVTLSAPSGAASYLWSNGATTQSITVSQSGSYTVQVSNTQGCTATSNATVVVVNDVPAKPVITAGGPTIFCAGGSVTLSAPAGFATYRWSNGATTSSISVTQTGSYTVVVTNSAGCSSPTSDATTVTVNPLPAKPVITASGPTIFNAGDSVILTAPAGFANYVWSNGATTRSIVVYTAGSYSVIVVNREGCSSPASDPVVVTLYAQPVVFVTVPGAGNQSGLNWANALPGNQISNKMLTYSGPARFWVRAGTYYPTQWPEGCYNCTSERDNAYLLRNNVILYGGFAGTESLLSQRNVAANPTILSGDIGNPGNAGDNAYHVVLSVRSDSTAKLDGFTVANGNASGYGYIYITVGGETFNQASGGGIFNSSANPVIANCTIRNNTAASSGGGMNNNNSSPIIRNSNFSSNSSSYNGGAIHNASSSPSISYSSFTANTASSNGGAIANANASPVISNSTFTRNTAYGGGGIYNDASSASIVNSAFADNNASYGGGIFNAYSSGTTVTNSVFANNSAGQGGAMFNGNSSPTITNTTFYAANPTGNGWSVYNSYGGPVITNSVIWSNAGAGITGGDPSIRYSIVKGISSGNNNLDTDPLFVNIADPDGADNILGTADDGLALQPCSPGINSGDNTANTQVTDVAGQGRIFGSIIDRGAYEYQGAATTPSMAVNGDAGTFIASPGSVTPLLLSCRTIGQLFSTGTSPVSGSLTAKAWVDATQTIFPNGQTFLKRHFEVTPANNATSATARLTLYATQQEFNDFNAASTTDIPSGPADAVGKANLRIFKFSGTSSDGSGAPGSYPQWGTEINPDDNDIVWNSSQNRWEITFNVSGFSGFFIGNGGNNILPVTLLSFTGKALPGNEAALAWRTASEVNTSYFELQRSADGRAFAVVAQLTAKGNAQSVTDYAYTDKGLTAGLYHYRLRMVDKDGKESFSAIVVVSFRGEQLLTLYPVPAKKDIWIGGTSASRIGKTVLLMDVQGKVLQQVRISQWPQRLDVASLAAGTYLIKVEGEKTLSFVKE